MLITSTCCAAPPTVVRNCSHTTKRCWSASASGCGTPRCTKRPGIGVNAPIKNSPRTVRRHHPRPMSRSVRRSRGRSAASLCWTRSVAPCSRPRYGGSNASCIGPTNATGSPAPPANGLAAALVEMAQRAMACPADAQKPGPLLLVLAGQESLARICELSTGVVIDPHLIVPYLGVADVQTIVFDGADRPITGSPQRTFRGLLRRAIQAHDRHCQHPSGATNHSNDPTSITSKRGPTVAAPTSMAATSNANPTTVTPTSTTKPHHPAPPEPAHPAPRLRRRNPDRTSHPHTHRRPHRPPRHPTTAGRLTGRYPEFMSRNPTGSCRSARHEPARITLEQVKRIRPRRIRVPPVRDAPAAGRPAQLSRARRQVPAKAGGANGSPSKRSIVVNEVTSSRRRRVTWNSGTPRKIVAAERVMLGQPELRGSLRFDTRQERRHHAAQPAFAGRQHDAPAEGVDRRAAGERGRSSSPSISAILRRSAATASTTGTASMWSSSSLGAWGDLVGLDVVDGVERRDAELASSDVGVPHRLHQLGQTPPDHLVPDDGDPPRLTVAAARGEPSVVEDLVDGALGDRFVGELPHRPGGAQRRLVVDHVSSEAWSSTRR